MRQDDPEVSVIIPTRNRAHVLARSIDSVLAQTVESLELIIVDDGSDDGTKQLVEGIDDPRVRYVRHDRSRGAPAARNTGIRASRGRHYAFQDSDDEWLPTKLERQLELIDHYDHGVADVVTCGVTKGARNGRERHVVAESEELSYEGLLALTDTPWGGQTILVRRTPATLAVFFDEDLPAGQDWDYVLRLALVTRVVSVQEPLVRIGRASGEHIGTLERKLAGRRVLRKKYDAELRRHPSALVNHEVGLGVLSIYCGELAEGRRHFVNALRASRFRPRIALLALASLLGPRALRIVFRRLDVGTKVG